MDRVAECTDLRRRHGAIGLTPIDTTVLASILLRYLTPTHKSNVQESATTTVLTNSPFAICLGQLPFHFSCSFFL